MKVEMTLAEFLEAEGYTAIQMTRNIVGHFEVAVLVNGREALFLVDTGASGTVIARESAARLELEMRESDVKAGGIGTSEHAVALGEIETLTLQSLRVEALPIRIIDMSHVNLALERHGGRGVDGVIGGDLLSARSAIIDYARATLYLQQDSAS